MVGAEGFEPSAFWSRTKRATSLRYAPPESKPLTTILPFLGKYPLHFLGKKWVESINSTPLPSIARNSTQILA